MQFINDTCDLNSFSPRPIIKPSSTDDFSKRVSLVQHKQIRKKNTVLANIIISLNLGYYL